MATRWDRKRKGAHVIVSETPKKAPQRQGRVHTRELPQGSAEALECYQKSRKAFVEGEKLARTASAEPGGVRRSEMMAEVNALRASSVAYAREAIERFEACLEHDQVYGTIEASIQNWMTAANTLVVALSKYEEKE